MYRKRLNLLAYVLNSRDILGAHLGYKVCPLSLGHSDICPKLRSLIPSWPSNPEKDSANDPEMSAKSAPNDSWHLPHKLKNHLTTHYN